MAAHYEREWWYPDGAGTLATNQRAIVFGPGDTNLLATIYADAGLTVPLPNPTVTDPVTGVLEFYVPDGYDTYWIFVGPVGQGESEEWSTAGGGPFVEIAGDMMTGALQINQTGESPGYPIGPTAAIDTGLDVLSSFLGGDDDGNPAHYDSTGRINLYSYQRANFYSWGESIRHFLMKANAKIMHAWYFPDGGYDGNGDPVGDFVPVVWAGAHWEANDGLSLHKHWSVETPDSGGAIQTRFEVRYGDPNDPNAIAGLDKTLVATNLCDFVVRCSNGQELRLSANDSHDKQIMFSLDHEGDTAYRRWALRVTSTDADFQLRRYDDTGVFLDSPIAVDRGTGLVSIGGTSGTADGLNVTRDGNTACTIATTADGTATLGVLVINPSSDSKRAVDIRLTGDSTSRIRLDTSLGTGGGTITLGNGTLADTNMYRSNPGVVKTDGAFQATTSLRINTTSLGSGVGVLAIANATSTPSGTPSGGGVVYVESGALKYKGSAGTVTTIAPA